MNDMEAERREVDRRERELIVERLNKIENGYYDMSRSIIRLESTVEGLGKLVDRFENVLERMNKTLGELNTTIVTINSKVEDNTIDIKDIDTRVISVDNKITLVDNKGKIDFLSVVKDNFGKFVFGGGLVGALLFWVDHLIDTYFKINGK